MPAPWLIELRVPPLAAASFPPSSFFLLDSLDVRFDVDLSSLEPIFVDVSVKFSTRLISVEGSGEFRSRRVLSFYEKGRIPGLNIDESDINVRKRGEIKGERKDNVGRFQF